VARDVTEAKENEARKSGFNSMLKHDLNGIMMLIKGNVELLQRSAGKDGIAPECAASLDAISRNSNLITNIVEDMAFYSKLDTGSYYMKLDKEPVGLLLTEIAAMHGGMAESKGVTLAKDIEQGLPEIIVDRSLIYRAVINLVTNAINYSGGDTIILSANKTAVNGIEHVSISVTDNGRGIDREHHEKVFQSHFRVPAQNNVYGSGLGLAIVKQVAEAHSGRASIVSAPGKGSTFTVSLPVYSNPQTV
jgi:signal transduction histidine kinase